MSKHKLPPDGGDRRGKRRKLEQDSIVKLKAEKVGNLRHLQKLLAFQQDSPADLRTGILSFKEFLDAILYDEQNADKERQLQLLKDYCDSQTTTDEEGQGTTCFPDIIQSWTYANELSNEPLLSSIPAVLALFLKTVSTHLDFRTFGISLCKFILQPEQLNLLNRGLGASKTKEHLVSPCIRLLTEIVSFDGGALANTVYSRREVTLKRLDLFLSMTKESSGDPEEDRRKPSVRTNTIRYLLANLRFQPTVNKGDLLSQGKLWKAFFEELRNDPRDVILEILSSLEKNLTRDTHIHRRSKAFLFNQWNLQKLSHLYGFKNDYELVEPDKPVSELVHGFLLMVCTDVTIGVLLPQSGWYPVGSQPNEADTSEDGGLIDLGLDSPAYTDNYHEKVPIRNSNLAQFVQGLRVESDTLQMQLALAIFDVAPELIADYFSKKTTFVSEPKATSQWLGQSAFLFSTIQLPVPVNGGWRGDLPKMPPPTSIAIESILPRPLTQKVIVRCLNQSVDIITLFGLRITKASLMKLSRALQMYELASKQSSIWMQAASKLTAEFGRRCPTMKDIVSAFRRTPTRDSTQRVAVLETLSAYYQVLPHVALEEKVDLSVALAEVLERLAEENGGEDMESSLTQLNLLIEIAHHSPSMRWWQKPEKLTISPFSSILNVLIQKPQDTNNQQIRMLLHSIVLENGIVSEHEKSKDAFFASFLSRDACTPRMATFTFLDNCITRLIRKPVHYLDQLQGLQATTHSDGPLSLLLVVAAEQWPYVAKSDDEQAEKQVAEWLGKYLGFCKHAGEDEMIVSLIRDQMVETASSKKSRSALKKAFKQVQKEDLAAQTPSQDVTEDAPITTSTTIDRSAPEALETVFSELPKEPESSEGVVRWKKNDLELSFQEGHVGELLLCLCSQLEEIRRSAFSNLTTLMHTVEKMSYSESRPIYLLLGEVVETVKNCGLDTPLPYVFGELAAQSSVILTSPLHKLYGKINKYLNKGPRWEVAKIPSYWVDRILLREPEQDDGHAVEVNWLLDLLVSGLRTEQDMELYRQCSVFERCLSLYCSLGTNRAQKKKILHLVYRASQVGGSTTLITRAGIVSWIQGQAARNDNNHVLLGQLMRRLYDSSDHERVARWGGEGLVEVVEGMSLDEKVAS